MNTQSQVKQDISRSRRGRKMTETHERLLAALMVNGLAFAAEAMGCETTEAHRKFKGETGFKLDQLAKLFDALGIQIVTDADTVVVNREDYESLARMAHRHLENKIKTFNGVERRKNVVEFKKDEA